MRIDVPVQPEGGASSRSDRTRTSGQDPRNAGAADMRIATRDELRGLLGTTYGQGATEGGGSTLGVAALLDTRDELAAVQAEPAAAHGSAESMLDCYLFVPRAGVRQSLLATGVIGPNDVGNRLNPSQASMPIRCLAAVKAAEPQPKNAGTLEQTIADPYQINRSWQTAAKGALILFVLLGSILCFSFLTLRWRAASRQTYMNNIEAVDNLSDEAMPR